VGEAGDFHGGRAVVRIKTAWGFIDRDGKMAIPARY
jgi:hypothetical protein